MYVCKRYGTDPSRRYGTGVWNRCGLGPCSGIYNLTCTPIYIYLSCINMYYTFDNYAWPLSPEALFCETYCGFWAQTSLRSKGLTTAFSTSGTGEGCPCGASVHNHRLQLSWSPYLSCSLKTWLRKKYLTNVSSFRNGHCALHVGYRWIFYPKGLTVFHVTPLKDRRRIAANIWKPMPKQ